MTKIFTSLKLTSVITFIVLTIVVAPVSFAKSKSEKKETLRVLYWNIQNGMWAGQPEKYESFVEWIRAQDPDICIVAEAAQIYYDGTNTQMPNEDRYLPAHWGELCARWGHDYHVVTPRRPSTASYNFGLTNYPQAVTSRYPIDSIYIVKGHKPDSVVVNYSGWYQVVDQVVLLQENPDKELWIMAGDFNSYSGKDNYIYKWNDVDKAFQTQDYMTLQSPFFDLVSEYYPDVFMPTCGNLRIDYMYVSKPVLRACTNVIAQPDSYTKRVNSGVDKFYIPSDHYPIIAEFKISKLK